MDQVCNHSHCSVQSNFVTSMTIKVCSQFEIEWGKVVNYCTYNLLVIIWQLTVINWQKSQIRCHLHTGIHIKQKFFLTICIPSLARNSYSQMATSRLEPRVTQRRQSRVALTNSDQLRLITVC